MMEEKFIMFKNRLDKVVRHLGKLAKKKGVSCYRLYDHDLPEFPFCIELYEANIYVAEYKRRHGMDEKQHDAWLENSVDVISRVLNSPKRNIYLKLRQKKAGRQGQYQKTGELKSEFIVNENGLRFIINLSDYLDTGLFLDHRMTREKVRVEAKDKNVLNLFAYTGSFSVYAAAGGASKVVTVDLSNTYLDWAKRNMQLNGLNDPIRFQFEQADVLQYLPSIPDQSFDLVVLDPPTFSNSKRMEDVLDIQRDHTKLINECLRILQAAGRIYFSTNYKDFKPDIAAIHSDKIKDITKQTTPFDFEGRLNRVCYLFEK